MNLKKALGLIGVVCAVSLLVLVGFRVITWQLFWLGTTLLAGFAWWVLPKLPE